MLFAAGIAVLSAAAVFLFFLLREQRAPIVVDAGTRTGTERSAPLAPGSGAPVAPTIDFKTVNFSLARSRSYRAVGPLRVRLLRTERSDSYDIAILVNRKRTKRSRMKPGEPIAIALPGVHPNTRIVVTRVAKNQIWGYLVTPKSAMEPMARDTR